MQHLKYLINIVINRKEKQYGNNSNINWGRLFHRVCCDSYTRNNGNFRLGGTMKAKDYKSITELLEKKYKKKFYLFQDFEDIMNRIKQKESEGK